MTIWDYLVLIVYFALMLGIGFWAMRRVKVQEDYFMGGRSFGKLLQTFAAFGAGTGPSDPVNTGRTTFSSGISGMWSVMYWLFVTPFYWIASVWYRRMRHLTLGDWFTERYESRPLGAAYALFGIVFYMVYGSMLFAAIGKVAGTLLGAGEVSVAGHVVGLDYVMVPILAVVVLLYGIAGGLRAAYWTDLIQGLCIILLSIMLIPSGLNALVEKFGDPATQGLSDGFRIMHEQLPAQFFSVVGVSGRSEFPLYFIVVVVLINLVGIVVQPHFIATGGGSAKTEMNARVGLVVGNFLKRFCTVGWVLTGLIAVTLLADNAELAEDPDKTWGIACKALLGPGLIGLMLACLLAALMSSIDAYMIVSSALIVRNVYVPFISPAATEAQCIGVARVTGILIVGGAVVIALSMMDVFAQLQLTWIVGVLFAAPFWVGMYWRRATTAAAWASIGFCALTFFLVPWLAPVLVPGLTTNPRWSQTTDLVQTTTSRTAASSDVARRRATIALWEQRQQKIDQLAAATRAESLARLGPRPAPLTQGDSLIEVTTTGGQAIYWSGGVKTIDENGNGRTDARPEPIGPAQQIDDLASKVVLRYADDVPLRGVGNFKIDFLLYDLAGLDLRDLSDSTLKTLEFPPKIFAPFVVMIVVSFLTGRNSKEALDRYYVKMKTPVDPDPALDIRQLEQSYREPNRFDYRKLFAGSDFEFQKPTAVDAIGFIASVVTCFVIIGAVLWLAGIGSKCL
ncbi:MAG: sodium:solute symporter family protein [Pirellulales bacterium]